MNQQTKAKILYQALLAARPDALLELMNTYGINEKLEILLEGINEKKTESSEEVAENCSTIEQQIQDIFAQHEHVERLDEHNHILSETIVDANQVVFQMILRQYMETPPNTCPSVISGYFVRGLYMGYLFAKCEDIMQSDVCNDMLAEMQIRVFLRAVDFQISELLENAENTDGQLAENFIQAASDSKEIRNLIVAYLRRKILSFEQVNDIYYETVQRIPLKNYGEFMQTLEDRLYQAELNAE